jgi:hypothetical protein
MTSVAEEAECCRVRICDLEPEADVELILGLPEPPDARK